MYGDLNAKLSQMKPGEALNAFHAADAKFVKDNAQLAIAGRANQTFDVSYAEKLKSAARATTDYTKAEEMALLKQQAQMAGEDKTTKLYTDMLQKERETSINLQQAIHTGVPLLSKGLLEIATKSADLSNGFRSIIDSITGNSAASSAAPTSGASLGPAGTQRTYSQDDLRAMGFRMHNGDVQATGKVIDSRLIELAKKIQNELPGFSHFSGFNDKFHQGSPSGHTEGRAVDFGLTSRPSREEGQRLVSILNSMGATMSIDEYNNPSSKSTAGHIHVEIPTFAEGGELAAGKLGIAGEAGPEFVQGPATITSSNDIMSAFNNMTMMIGQQTGAIDELIRIAKNGNDIQTKILRMQS
jgi:hypothetical protein